MMLRKDYFKPANRMDYATRPVWDYPTHENNHKLTLRFYKIDAAREAGYENREMSVMKYLENKVRNLDQHYVDNADAKHWLLALLSNQEICLSANDVSTIIAVCEDNHFPVITDWLKDIYQKEVLDALYSEDKQEPTAEEKIDDLFNQFSAGNLTLNQLKAECKKLAK